MSQKYPLSTVLQFYCRFFNNWLHLCRWSDSFSHKMRALRVLWRDTERIWKCAFFCLPLVFITAKREIKSYVLLYPTTISGQSLPGLPVRLLPLEAIVFVLLFNGKVLVFNAARPWVMTSQRIECWDWVQIYCHYPAPLYGLYRDTPNSKFRNLPSFLWFRRHNDLIVFICKFSSNLSVALKETVEDIFIFVSTRGVKV